MEKKSILRKLFFKRNIQGKGYKAESAACIYLSQRGYTIVERNFKNQTGYALGEIDIVTVKKDSLIFFEVKSGFSRNSSKHLPPELNITQDKLRKLHRIIHHYRKTHPQYIDMPFSLDALIVEYADSNSDTPHIRHLPNIFL